MATARFLVIDGYNREARDELAAGGAGRAGDLYVAMLGKVPARGRLRHPASGRPRHPAAAGRRAGAIDGIAWTGCSLTIYDDDPRVGPQIELARAAFAPRCRASAAAGRRRWRWSRRAGRVPSQPARPRDGHRPQDRADARGPRPPALRRQGLGVRRLHQPCRRDHPPAAGGRPARLQRLHPYPGGVGGQPGRRLLGPAIPPGI